MFKLVRSRTWFYADSWKARASVQCTKNNNSTDQENVEARFGIASLVAWAALFVSNFLEIDPVTQIYPKFSFSKQSPRLCSSKEQLYFFLVQFNTTDRLFVKLQAYLIKIVHLKLVYEEFNFYPIQTLTCLVRECFISSVKSRGDREIEEYYRIQHFWTRLKAKSLISFVIL